MAKKPKKGEETPAEDTLSIDGEGAAASEEVAQQGPMLSNILVFLLSKVWVSKKYSL